MNWLENFKPKMIVFVGSCMEDPEARYVQAVCAFRVLLIKYKIAVKKAHGNKTILKLLRGQYER